MTESIKSQYIEAHFKELESALVRATELTKSNRFHLEGITMLLCHIAALSKSRYPDYKDWAAFKALVKNYSGIYEIFENIDLLLFYQWPHSKLSNDRKYQKLGNYEAIVAVLEAAIGDEESIRNNSQRYMKREHLLQLLRDAEIPGFDENNFNQYIELFSNNQIVYEFARCEAVHNHSFPLINIGCTFPDMERTYESNHQITAEVLINCLAGVIRNLKTECLEKEKWPKQL